MSTVLIFDRAMCCSTGICGPDVDPVLPRFAADLDWLASQGHSVSRYNLSQNPAEFVSHDLARQMLEEHGVDCLPLIVVDDRVVSRGDYATRDNLALWTGTKLSTTAKPSLPIAEQSECCGESGCC